jgi:dienelactone hydrolase
VASALSRCFALGFLAFCWLLPATAEAQRLHRYKLEGLAKKWFQQRPWGAFEDWDPAVRQELLREADQLHPIPEDSLETVVEILWKIAVKKAPRLAEPRWQTPYGPATWIQSGKGGRKRGLILGLHGGGEGVGSASDAASSWKVKDALCVYPQGIRLVHDTWNTVHGEKFLLTLIEYAKVSSNIDPDRVYVMGFSMGGTGSWFMAGRHPDLFAGATPAHGVFMADPKSQLARKEDVKSLQHGLLPNVRNLAMYYYTGSVDRNCMPGTYLFAWDRLLELRQQDPEGYQGLHFQIHEGLAHSFPTGEPAKGIEFLLAQRRDTFPQKLVWEYAAQPFPRPSSSDRTDRWIKRWYYWLHCSDPQDRMWVTATRQGNLIDLEVRGADPRTFSIYLHPRMWNSTEDLVVQLSGREVYRGRPQADLRVILESLDQRLDRSMVFDRRISLESIDAEN